MKTLKTLVVVMCGLALQAAPVTAQEQPVRLEGDVKAVKVVTDADGAETTQLVEPTKIVPGDRLVFGTDYANGGSDAVENFDIRNALPAAVRLAPDAAADLTVSVDGGESWGTLADLSITDEDGATRAATHDDVTHVRWTIASIAPGENGRVEYPAIIR